MSLKLRLLTFCFCFFFPFSKGIKVCVLGEGTERGLGIGNCLKFSDDSNIQPL